MRTPLVAMLTVATLFTGSLTACGPSRKELQAEIDKIKGELAGAQDQIKTLQGKIAELEREIADRDEKIASLEKDKNAMQTELEALRAEQDRRKAELDTYRQLFAKLKKLIDAGTIKVSFRKGRMIVELASAVLFDSGKIELKDGGKTALDEIVVALQSVNDRDFMIAGHTDTDPIKTKKFKSNWELSTARAVVVVNYMIEKGFPAAHLGAAGFAEIDPVAANDTPENKALNRRIEIVLMPDLGELKGIEDMITGGK
ncbi:MAG TPA: OmpA family protein [Nannocystaceae bacterium]|nr:OmpA family protein [Nannocystaceae bacterium]